MTYKVRVKFNYSWTTQGRNALGIGLARMVTDIHQRATMLAPVDTGALVNSGRFEKTGDLHYKIIFGNSRVPYAALRERQNRLHPGTRFYLKRAGEYGQRNVNKYFNHII